MNVELNVDCLATHKMLRGKLIVYLNNARIGLQKFGQITTSNIELKVDYRARQ